MGSFPRVNLAHLPTNDPPSKDYYPGLVPGIVLGFILRFVLVRHRGSRCSAIFVSASYDIVLPFCGWHEFVAKNERSPERQPLKDI